MRFPRVQPMKTKMKRQSAETDPGPNPALTMEGAERQNMEAFEEVYRQHHERVYFLCLRVAGSDAKAQSFMEEAFLALFRKLGTFREVSAFYQTYAQRPLLADFVANWICRQSDQYKRAICKGAPSWLPSFGVETRGGT